jgi:two-component system sensor histidine kinase/response regulator
MIVDDNVENLRLLANILGETDRICRPITDPQSALRSAKHHPPDLILLDIKMPVMDGFELCQTLKKEDGLKDIPVIFISALNETADKTRAFELGGVDYISKPFQEREVKARVKAHLDLRLQKQQLVENLEKLQKLEQLRDDLVHVILHDIQNPLMLIQGNLQLLTTFETENLNSQSKRYIKEAANASIQCLDMVGEILTTSKMGSDCLQLQLTQTDLNRLTSRIIEAIAPILGSKKITFDPDALVGLVKVDPAIIARVIQNLLNNAIKFSPEDGIVELKIAESGENIIISISDQGPGIPVDQREKIFQKYGQTQSGQKRRGTGLGLYFCKMAAEAHGGAIELRPREDCGSTFVLFLKRNN